MNFLDDLIEITYNDVRFLSRRGTYDENILNEIWVSGMYSYFLDTLRENSIIIDIGAHIGGFSLLLANKYPKSKIFCFEPHPENYDLLVKNIKRNNFENRISAFQYAISHQKGKEKLYTYSGGNTGMHSTSLKYKLHKEALEIDAITMDDIFKLNDVTVCDFLKIDCEGAEYRLFESLKKENIKRIRHISLELHFKKSVLGYLQYFLAQKFHYNKLIHYLQKNNFSLRNSFVQIYDFINVSSSYS